MILFSDWERSQFWSRTCTTSCRLTAAQARLPGWGRAFRRPRLSHPLPRVARRRAGRCRPAAGQPGVRRGLQPRAVARRGLARGRGADARGRRQPGQRRRLLLGAAGAGPGRVRLRLAGPGARAAARRRHRWSTWPPRPPSRRPGSAGRIRRPSWSTRDGRVLGGGGRQSFCPSSAGVRRGRRADHRASWPAATPATRRWRCGTSTTSTAGVNALCYCPPRPRRSGSWLRERYGDLAALNEAWGTTFWGQRYGDWDEIDAAARRRPPPSTRASSWTSCASPPTRTWPTSGASGTSCTAGRPACR